MGRQSTARRARLAPGWITASGGFLVMLARAIEEALRLLLTPAQYVRLVAEQIFTLGIKSIPLVIVSGMATGAIMAIQFGYGLQRYGGINSVPRLVGLAVFRELGPVLSSLLLAGRVGSGITAELASMSVTQQIDALRALGTSPYSTLVLPRVIACVFAFPILGLCANFLGVLAGMLVCRAEFGIPLVFYYTKTVAGVWPSDLLTGVVKMTVFGLLVALAGCWKGLNTSGGTQSVGNSATWTVVTATIMIMLGDVALNKLFVAMGYFR